MPPPPPPRQGRGGDAARGGLDVLLALRENRGSPTPTRVSGRDSPLTHGTGLLAPGQHAHNDDDDGGEGEEQSPPPTTRGAVRPAPAL
ncbi:unnamed protein product [Arctogadus glacialis]